MLRFRHLAFFLSGVSSLLANATNLSFLNDVVKNDFFSLSPGQGWTLDKLEDNNENGSLTLQADPNSTLLLSIEYRKDRSSSLDTYLNAAARSESASGKKVLEKDYFNTGGGHPFYLLQTKDSLESASSDFHFGFDGTTDADSDDHWFLLKGEIVGSSLTGEQLLQLLQQTSFLKGEASPFISYESLGDLLSSHQAIEESNESSESIGDQSSNVELIYRVTRKSDSGYFWSSDLSGYQLWSFSPHAASSTATKYAFAENHVVASTYLDPERNLVAVDRNLSYHVDFLGNMIVDEGDRKLVFNPISLDPTNKKISVKSGESNESAAFSELELMEHVVGLSTSGTGKLIISQSGELGFDARVESESGSVLSTFSDSSSLIAFLENQASGAPFPKWTELKNRPIIDSLLGNRLGNQPTHFFFVSEESFLEHFLAQAYEAHNEGPFSFDLPVSSELEVIRPLTLKKNGSQYLASVPGYDNFKILAFANWGFWTSAIEELVFTKARQFKESLSAEEHASGARVAIAPLPNDHNHTAYLVLKSVTTASGEYDLLDFAIYLDANDTIVSDQNNSDNDLRLYLQFESEYEPPSPGSLAHAIKAAKSFQMNRSWKEPAIDLKAFETTEINEVILDSSSPKDLEESQASVPFDASRIVESSNEGSSGWYRSEWFGTFYQSVGQWIFHQNLGWIYPVAEYDDSSWFYSEKTGWIWTTEDLFPFFFSAFRANWLYLHERWAGGPGNPYFFNYATLEWGYGEDHFSRREFEVSRIKSIFFD